LTNGRVRAATSVDVWDRSGTPVATLQGHTGPVNSAVFASDGSRILTASDDRTARLWDSDGKPLAILQGHSGQVNGAVFAPDDSRIVTASDDNTARLWDRDGQALAILQGDTGPVHSAMFSLDGGRIVTASADNTARLWEAFPNPQALIDRVKAKVPRCLTREQRQLFFLSPMPPSWCVALRKWPFDPSP
jgi:WD40 repeat protein